MTLRLNGSTSGYVELEAPATAGSNNITLPSGNGSANQFLKNGSTAGTLGWSSMVEDSSGRVLIGSTSSTGGKLVVENNTGNLFLKQTTGDFGHVLGQNDSDGALTFSRRDTGTVTERMRIGANGNVFVGGTSGGARLNVEATWNQAPVNINVISSNPSAAQIDFKFNSSAVGNIVSTSTSTAYNTSSDYRLKENVANVTDGITRLQQLKPSRFNFIADPDKTVDGFIAHEVQSVVPEAITGEKDAVDDEGNPIYQGIDQSKLVPLLTAALQEAVAKIETQDAAIAALETRLAALEATP